MKAISAVIAVIMLLMITVALVGMSYVWMTALTTTTTQSGTQQVEQFIKQASNCMRIESAYSNKVVLFNCGIGTITKDSLSVYIDNIPVNISSDFSSIAENKRGTLNISGLWQFGLGEHMLRMSNGLTEVSKFIEAVPHESAVGVWKMDDGSGTTAGDSSGNGNSGMLSGNIIADFENTLDGFSLDCGGLPTSSFVTGKIGQGLKLWSTGGDGLACAVKPVGSFSAGYTIFFYAKGFVQAQFYDNSGASYVQDVETGCRTADGGANIFGACNGGNPYTDWRLFKVVAFRSSTGATLYIYNNGIVGETNAGYYDFITSGPTWVAGKFGKGLSFDGVDDHVSAPDSPSLSPTSGITIAAWVKLNTAGSNWQPISFKEGPEGRAWWFGFFPGRADRIHWSNGGLSIWDLSCDIPSALNTWRYIVVTYESGGIGRKMFVNGALICSDISTGNLLDTSGTLYIGGGGWQPINGIIDDVMIFSRALTPDEIVWLRMK